MAVRAVSADTLLESGGRHGRDGQSCQILPRYL